MMRQLLSRAATAVLTTAVGLSAATSATAAPKPATTSLQQHTVVKWNKGESAGKDRATFSLPGIGYGEIVCRTDATHIRIYPDDITRETSMWTTVTHATPGGSSWAVKNARIFTFATPTTPLIATGTGASAQEGFNIENGVEDSGTGVVYGVISQRTAFNQPASQTAPLTSFSLDWKWSGFDGPAGKQKCKVEALFFTTMPAGKKIKTKKAGGTKRSPGLPAGEALVDWHGEADAALGKSSSAEVQLPYVGVLQANCPTGRDSAAALTITADDKDEGIQAYVETYMGSSTDAPLTTTPISDPLTGQLRIPLPTNGFLRIVVTNSKGQGSQLYVSSWRQTNDEKPAENFCEIAAHALSIAGGQGEGEEPGPT